MVTKLQIERAGKVSQIASMIKTTFDAGKNVDKEKLILVLQKDFLISRRTAVEYINATRVWLNWIEEKGVLKKQKTQLSLDFGRDADIDEYLEKAKNGNQNI